MESFWHTKAGSQEAFQVSALSGEAARSTQVNPWEDIPALVGLEGIVWRVCSTHVVHGRDQSRTICFEMGK